MPGILRNRPRVAVVFAALTLLLAALAVSLPSPGLTKSTPEAAVSFNEGGGGNEGGGSPITLLLPEETTIAENNLAQHFLTHHNTVTIVEDTIAEVFVYKTEFAPGGIPVNDRVDYSISGEDADDFYVEEYQDEDGRYIGAVYNSRVFDFEDENDRTLEFRFKALFRTFIVFTNVTVRVEEKPESPQSPKPEPTPTPTEKPGKPRNLSVVPGSGSLTATWDPPAAGGAASGYNVEYRAAGVGNNWARIMSNGVATSIGISGLERSGYLVRVQAVNEIGASGWARQRTSGPGAAEPPGEPQNLSLAPGDGSLTATWDPPADGGAASGYTVEYRPVGGGNWWRRVVYNGAATSVEITGLEPGSYLVRVQALNEIGASGWARQRTPEPTPPEPTEAPGRPQNMSVVPGTGSLTVTWDPPVSGGAASGYNVDYRFAGGGNRWVRVRANADVTSVEITGLEPDLYVVRVRAVNEIGESRRALKRVEVGP